MLKHWRILLALAVLAIVAYLPTLKQPLLEDDFPNIAEGHALGFHILTDPIFGIRSTWLLMMDGIYRIFGVTPAPFYCVLIVLHILCTWLLYALGCWRRLNPTLTAWAAAFFAVYEGHQEGVMWLSGSTEPLLFLFGVSAMICWVRFLQQGNWGWYILALVAYVPALYTKESAFIIVALLGLPVLFESRWLRSGLLLIPFAAAGGLAVLHVLHTRTYSFRFNDGSFSLHAPFWLTLPNSFARLFWFWGALALIAILIWKPARYLTIAGIGLAWTGLALIPYSFLTYATRVPSRQTYLASAGVALIVGLALETLLQRQRRPVLATICAVMLLHNVGYLWTKKREQFLERAAPTEQLIALVRQTKGPVYVECFPRPPLVANWAVQLSTGRNDLIWDPAQSSHAGATFCFGRK